MGSELQGRIIDLDKDVNGNYEVGRKSDVPSFLPLPQFSQSHFPGSSPFLIIFPSKPPSFAGVMPFMQPSTSSILRLQILQARNKVDSPTSEPLVTPKQNKSCWNRSKSREENWRGL